MDDICTMCWSRQVKEDYSDWAPVCGKCGVTIRQVVGFLTHQGHQVIDARYLATEAPETATVNGRRPQRRPSVSHTEQISDPETGKHTS